MATKSWVGLAIGALLAAACLTGPAPRPPARPVVWPLDVTVTDSAGAPLEAHLVISDGPNAGRAVDTGPDGRAHLEALAESGFTICADRPGYGHACEGIGLTAARTVAIRLTPGEGPLPRPEALAGFPSWPADLRAIRTDFDSGPFLDSTEAAGWARDRQDALLGLLVARGYQWATVSIVNGDTSNDRAAYDGFADRDGVFGAWIDRLVAARIVPIVVPFQGARASLALVVARPYDNRWARAELPAWAWWLDAKTAHHAILLMGFEVNKFAQAPDGDPEHRGVSNLWGWNGLSAYWCRAWVEAVGLPALVHPLPGTYGPEPGEGGRTWDAAGWWRGSGTDDGRQWCDGLALQFDLDAPHGDAYYLDELRRARAVLPAGKVLVGFEYVRPGTEFPGSANVGEDRARHIGQLLLRSGLVDGVANGR